MDRVDLLILIGLIYVVIRGFKIGFLRLVGSTIGLVGGLIFGSWVSLKLASHVNGASNKAILIICIEGIFAIGFSYLGEFLGHLLGLKLKRPVFRKTNKFLGAPFEALSLLLIVWIVASGVANVHAYDIGYYVRHSAIIKALDNSLPNPPDYIARLEKVVSPNGFPNVFVGLEPQHPVVPNNSVVSQQVVNADSASVVKIQSLGCGGEVQGSGVVIGKGFVLTNAHVVAGTSDTQVLDGTGTYHAVAVWFDPNEDIAVLRVNAIADKALTLSSQTDGQGTNGVILGYPGGGPLEANSAVILDEITAQGQNIYNQGDVNRNIYELEGNVQPGNSGGPLIDSNGVVIGIIFAKSVSQPDVGYSLLSSDLINSVQAAESQNTPVSVGACASE
jgi:S1-C subfamily serine protease